MFTNGCFDILHVGHVRCLKAAAAMGDVLVLGLNSDVSVKRLKGDSRPVNSQSDRAEMLSEYPFVDYIVVFDEDTPEKIVRMLRPDVWVKGGDCNPENSPAIELALADELGIKRVYTSYVTGKSTTGILQRSAQEKDS